MTRAASGRAALSRGRSGTSGKDAGVLDRYFRKSELPLHALVFLLPLMAIYEFASRRPVSDLVAFRLMQLFFRCFGASGQYLPAAAVIGILLTWHVVRQDRWEICLKTLALMVVESIGFALPLLMVGTAVIQWHHQWNWSGPHAHWVDSAILSAGAGIYEELVFRLAGMTLLHLLFADLMGLPKSVTSLLMVLVSAILFSLYHYLGDEPFLWQTFAFRTVAGIYFGILFLCRGFGVTAGSHVAYDVLLALLRTGA